MLSRSLLRLLGTALTVLFACGCVATVKPKAAAPGWCPRHHTKLESRVVYRLKPGIFADPDESYIRVADRFPCHTPWYYTERPTEETPLRERIQFCARCDAELARAMK